MADVGEPKVAKSSAESATESVAKSGARSEHTRALIVQTALRLFRERGYEATTMRAIAKEAGVSVGNAYYYFGSKEELIQAYYDELQDEHLAACRAVLDAERDFAPRLLGVLKARVDTMVPYHEFAGKFFKNAAEPSSPLSVFSPESAATREGAIGLMGRVVTGSAQRPSDAGRKPARAWSRALGARVKVETPAERGLIDARGRVARPEAADS